MKEQDKLRTYLKELPREEPSGNFTFMVMERVKKESIKSPLIYQPIIGRNLWWKLFTGLILIFVGAIIFRTYFPGNEQAGLLQPLSQIDYASFFKPFRSFSTLVGKMPLTFVTTLVSVSALLLIDQLYNRFETRRG